MSLVLRAEAVMEAAERGRTGASRCAKAAVQCFGKWASMLRHPHEHRSPHRRYVCPRGRYDGTRQAHPAQEHGIELGPGIHT